MINSNNPPIYINTGRGERARGHVRAVVDEDAGGGGEDDNAVPGDAALREVRQGPRGEELPHPRLRRGVQVSRQLGIIVIQNLHE